MKAPDSGRRGLASSDPEAICASIRALVDRLLAGKEDDPMNVADAITPFKDHASARVRRAVADACEHLPDPAAESTLAVLRNDDDSWVCDAANHATKQRAVRFKAHSKAQTLDRKVNTTLDQISKQSSKAIRELSERAMWEREELLFQQMRHEMEKVLSAARTLVTDARLERKKPKPDERVVDGALEHVDRRLELAMELLDAAVMYSKTYKADFREQALRDLVMDAFAQLEGRQGDPRLDCRNEVAPDLVAEIDRAAMLSALQNVLQNAAESYPPDADRKPIRVSAVRLKGGNEVRIDISDSGAGISEKTKARLFDLFHTTKPTGTGLGLATIQRAIEQVHGGRLAIESMEGQGTTMRMTLATRRVEQQGTKGRRR